MVSPFPATPVITLFDPLGAFLGAGDGRYSYCFDDVVKLSGHACPTAAGAFLLSVVAMRHLYGVDEMPERGGIDVVVPGSEEEGVNGPISQVLTFITGAAGNNGFRGLGGRFGRKGLLTFDITRKARGFIFRRRDTGDAVTLSYEPHVIPPDPSMGEDLPLALSGQGGNEVLARFQEAWRSRVVRILEDGGKNTVRVL